MIRCRPDGCRQARVSAAYVHDYAKKELADEVQKEKTKSIRLSHPSLSRAVLAAAFLFACSCQLDLVLLQERAEVF